MDEKHRIEPNESLDALLDRVERGEEVVIRRDGKPVARLMQDPGSFDRSEALQAMHNILDMARGAKLGGLRFRDMINEGRKY